jgi:LysR family transcriptional regulator, glycine cleavage system transcriptional activator
VARTALEINDPAKLGERVLLEYDDPERPLLQWSHWFKAHGIARTRPRRIIRFTQYDQVIQAALAGNGVALARVVLVRGHLDSGALVAATRARPLPVDYAYWLICRQRSLGRGGTAVRKWVLSQAAVRRAPG